MHRFYTFLTPEHPALPRTGQPSNTILPAVPDGSIGAYASRFRALSLPYVDMLVP